MNDCRMSDHVFICRCEDDVLQVEEKEMDLYNNA